jgi:DNA-binding NtrC family response regulator
MENAKVAVFEDNHTLTKLYHDLLGSYGHQIVSSAKTMEQARELIASLEPGTLDAAIVDGNLSSGSTGDDGREIVRLLGERDGKLATIAMSGAGPIEGATHQVGKDKVLQLLDVLAEL